MKLLVSYSSLLLLASTALASHQHSVSPGIKRREEWLRQLRRDAPLASPGAFCGSSTADNEMCPTGYCCNEVNEDGNTCYECQVQTGSSCTTSKRALKPTRAGFRGELLPPSAVAAFLLGDGQWLHSNGSMALDYKYQNKAETFRNFFWHARPKMARSGLVQWAKIKVIKYSMKTLTRHLITSFKDPNRLLVLSEDYAARNSDLVRIIYELLSVPGWKEVSYNEHVIPRPVLEDVLAILCPRMGAEYCESEHEIVVVADETDDEKLMWPQKRGFLGELEP